MIWEDEGNLQIEKKPRRIGLNNADGPKRSRGVGYEGRRRLKEKVMEPFFPRLYVNDTDKWWPREYTMSKMAPYQHLTRPSQKPNYAGPSELPPKYHNPSSSRVASASSSKMCDEKKIISSPFLIPSAPAHSAKQVLSSCSDVVHPNETWMVFKRKCNENTDHKALNIWGNLSLTAKERSGPANLSSPSPKISYGNTDRDEFESGVSEYSRMCLAPNSKKQRYRGESAKVIPFPMFEGLLRCANTTYLKQSQPARNARISLNTNGNGNGWSLKASKIQLPANNVVSGRATTELGCKASIGTSHTSPNKSGNCIEDAEGKACWSSRLGEAERNQFELDSNSGLHTSSEDVVRLIGQKHFCEAREAIINQQEVFAVQVFELHRLVRVQKLIASSPHLLLEDYPSRGRCFKEVPSARVHVMESQGQSTKRKPQDSSQSNNDPTESATRKTALQMCSDVAMSSCGNHPQNTPPFVLVDALNDDSGWCRRPAGSQWLFPVMSPSEGLVCKTYPGPSPPADGIMEPVHGDCSRVHLSPVSAYGLPTSHQQPGVVISGAPAMAPNYFPPYSVLVLIPPPATEQVNQSTRSCGIESHDPAERTLTGEVRYNKQAEISSHSLNEKIPLYTQIKGSIWSHPHDKEQEADDTGVVKRDVLPLFPVAPSESLNKAENSHSSSRIEVPQQNQQNGFSDLFRQDDNTRTLF